MKHSLRALTVTSLLISSVAVFAHHGTAGSYDQTKAVKVQGTVKEFRWRNPHCALYIDGKDAAGHDVTYTLEMGSPNTLVKFGYTRTSFKPGDVTVMEMHPAFTNPASGEALSRHVTINGKELNLASGGDRANPGATP
jgi:hypothetical protein